VLASDSIPGESAVVSSMVEFLSLSAGPSAWAQALLQTIKHGRPKGHEGNVAVSESAFSIAHSAAQLIGIYSGAATR
jgi:hypothetical protein